MNKPAFFRPLILPALVALQAPLAAHGASFSTCTWLTPEYPHISSFNLRNSGRVDIKTSTQGECQPATDPVVVTAQVTLEVQGFLGFWSNYTVGVPISKNVQGTGQVWRRGELFAVGPCVPGTYRGRLQRSASLSGGAAVLLGDDIVSPSRPIDCKPTKVSMVIDDTGSMSGVIGSVASSLTSFINAQPEDEYTSWNLTTFKDSATNVGTTEDRAQVLSWVSALRASGGGDCPEDALGGINAGLSALGSDPATKKQMLVATDASAQDGDVDAIVARAQASGVKVNVLLTGDCGIPAVTARLSSQQVLKRIADQTGGQYFFIPGGTTSDFTLALEKIFADIANPVPTDTQPPLIQLSATPDSIWPPNHQMVTVNVNVTVTDNLDPNPKVELVGVTSSQPDDAQGDGKTVNDVVVLPNGQLQLRAERSPTGGPRIYTITYRAVDAAGNVAFATTNVLVPKSKGAAR
jgi:hypothetical protein